MIDQLGFARLQRLKQFQILTLQRLKLHRQQAMEFNRLIEEGFSHGSAFQGH
jgi:hypothetical protein